LSSNVNVCKPLGGGGGGGGGDSPAAAAARTKAVEKLRANARLLRAAASESYRGINMLESYVSLNMVGRCLLETHRNPC